MPAGRPESLPTRRTPARLRCAAVAIAAIIAAIAAGVAFDARASQRVDTRTQPAPARADFGGATVSQIVRELADWIVSSADHEDLPFLVVDKIGARLFVFDERGRLQGNAPVLLGSARGDESVPGIGERPIAAIRPEERTTPAGRFVAERGRNTHGEDVIWVDYDAAVSMHRVRTTNPGERRLQRLATPTVRDNRISYGCINVPAAFYDRTVAAALARGRAIVYVLPETRAPRALFGMP